MSIELEKQLITSCVYLPSKFSEASAIVVSSDFYNDNHKKIWAAMVELYEQDRLDVASLIEHCAGIDLIPVLNPDYASANIEGQAKKIKELSALRAIQAGATRIIGMTQDGAQIDEIKESLAEIGKTSGPTSGSGILLAGSFYGEVKDLYDNPHVDIYKTGIPALDYYYKLKRGELCVVGGIPNMGKSEFLDWLLVCAARGNKWKFAFFSPENYPLKHHIRKLIEKYSGETFLFCQKKRITPDEIRESIAWLNDNFFWLYPKESETNVDHILGKFRYLVRSRGISGVVIDPWNQLDHQRPRELSETEYISKTLSKIQRFAKEENVLVWLVVHPHMLKKNEDGEYDPPTPYELMGSAHWRNKSDNILCVHRSIKPGADGLYDDKVKIYFQKIRDQRNVGNLGEVTLTYDYTNGQYE